MRPIARPDFWSWQWSRHLVNRPVDIGLHFSTDLAARRPTWFSRPLSRESADGLFAATFGARGLESSDCFPAELSPDLRNFSLRQERLPHRRWPEAQTAW